MTAGNKNLSFFYDSNGKPAAVKYNLAYYYYITNALGDVVAIVNHNGLVMVTIICLPLWNFVKIITSIACIYQILLLMR